MNTDSRRKTQDIRPQRNRFFSAFFRYLFSVFCSGKRKNRAFTLVEVMVATVVLVVGVVVIFEAFLVSLDALAVFNNRLNAQWFFDAKTWQIQNQLDSSSDSFMPLQADGVLKLGTEDYTWVSTMQLVDPLQELYRVNLVLQWNQGNKNIKLKTQTMAKRYFNNSTP